VPESESLAVLTRVIEEDDEQNRRILGLSEVMGAACTDRGVPFIEVAAGLRDQEWRSDVASRDGAHPTAQGYERLSRMIYPAFAEWLPGLASSRR
jgi:acyl-CoA thioesterase-1